MDRALSDWLLKQFKISENEYHTGLVIDQEYRNAMFNLLTLGHYYDVTIIDVQVHSKPDGSKYCLQFRIEEKEQVKGGA